MKILNSSTNKYVDLTDQKITIYNCGPTVYNYVHIGNVRPLVIFDVLHRYLLRIKKEVQYIQNITDVDDKIIKASKAAGVSEKELSNKYTDAYIQLFDLLNVRSLMMPRVSDHIPNIIDYIQKLIDKGAAYIVDGDVYFDISKAKNYGSVSHQNIDALLDGVRKDNKTNKKNPLDFVLWKETSEGINWQSPWSKGRPGWHTECCVLINKYIGETVTIHGGGVDLKFPHHENENAQNNALFGHDIAKIWMHVGHINVDGAKMSKSLNNFILVKDIVNKDNANGLRWFFYKAKYQQPVNFTKDLLEEANKEVNLRIHALNVARTHNIANGAFYQEHRDIDKKFSEALADDLNIPNALSVLDAQTKELSTLIRNKQFAQCNNLCNVIAREFDVLGIRFDNIDYKSYLKLIKQWKEASDKKDYATADKLRAELIAKGLL